MRKGPKKKVCLLMSLASYDQICALAQMRHRTVSSYVRIVLDNYLRRRDMMGEGEDWWEVK